MKVPNKVLNAAYKMANNQPVTDDERKAVIDWAKPAIDRRSAPRAAETQEA